MPKDWGMSFMINEERAPTAAPQEVLRGQD